MSVATTPMASPVPGQPADLVPLALLPVEDLPHAVAARRHAGTLDLDDMVRAALKGLAWYCRRRDGRGLASFVNAMADAAPTDGKPMSGPAVSAGFVPSPANPDDCLLVVLGADGYPLTDGNGNTLAYSVKALECVADSPVAESDASQRQRLH